MVIVHRSWSQKHIYNRRNVKGEKGGDWRHSLFAGVREWSRLFLKRNPTLKMKMNKIEQKWVILFGGSGWVGSG
ncbi:hypothetical protein H5410_045518 [Solanum commersonii]|uniref:Uncharacterized protein n=1 Tax=Solanum commersonii TaxID=4109 RepID=A0A9J5XCZ4_SOLCO|nr:hypothetical protein H5410_045518 [Solanum commersonii]